MISILLAFKHWETNLGLWKCSVKFNSSKCCPNGIFLGPFRNLKIGAKMAFHNYLKLFYIWDIVCWCVFCQKTARRVTIIFLVISILLMDWKKIENGGKEKEEKFKITPNCDAWREILLVFWFWLAFFILGLVVFNVLRNWGNDNSMR